jgi:hypothetical protein
MRIQLAKRFYNHIDRGYNVQKVLVELGVFVDPYANQLLLHPNSQYHYADKYVFFHDGDGVFCEMVLYKDGSVNRIDYYKCRGMPVLGSNGWARLVFGQTLVRHNSRSTNIVKKQNVLYLIIDEFNELKEEEIVIDNMKQLGLDPKLVAENWKYTHMASLSRALDGRDPILHSWVSPDGLHRVICTDNNIIYFKMNDSKNWVEQGRVMK